MEGKWPACLCGSVLAYSWQPTGGRNVAKRMSERGKLNCLCAWQTRIVHHLRAYLAHMSINGPLFVEKDGGDTACMSLRKWFGLSVATYWRLKRRQMRDGWQEIKLSQCLTDPIHASPHGISMSRDHQWTIFMAQREGDMACMCLHRWFGFSWTTHWR